VLISAQHWFLGGRGGGGVVAVGGGVAEGGGATVLPALALVFLAGGGLAAGEGVAVNSARATLFKDLALARALAGGVLGASDATGLEALVARVDIANVLGALSALHVHSVLS